MRILTFLIAGLICFCVGTVSPAWAEDECAQWRVAASPFFLQQDNGFGVYLYIEGDQAHGLRGKAKTHSAPFLFGLLEGHVTAKKIVFTIHWNNGAVGGYEGTISPQGRVEGFTYDKNVKGSTAGFRASDLLHCAKWVKSAPPPQPPPESSGPQPKPDAIMNQSRSFCENYANAAVAAAREGQQLRCGNDGPRWSTDAGGHLNWCLSLGGDQSLPKSETAARGAGLNTCREVAQREMLKRVMPDR